MEESKDITRCSECNQIMTDPRLLRCFHTFCLHCLERSGSHYKSGEKMPCPRCQTHFVLPDEGLAGLRKNLFVDRLIQVTKLSKEPEVGTFCDICQGFGNDAMATGYCLECRDQLCARCCLEHKRQRPSSNHQVIAFGGLEKDELETKFSQDLCSQHSDFRVDRFCEDCTNGICKVCFIDNHQTHDCADLKTKADLVRTEIAEVVNVLESTYNDGIVRRELLMKQKKDFLEEIGDTETVILNRAQKLKDLVDSAARTLIAELDLEKQKGVNKLTSQGEELDDHLTTLTSLKGYCNDILEKGSANDLCCSVKDLRNRTRTLQGLNEFHMRRQILLPRSTLSKPESDDVLSMTNMFGQIKTFQPPTIVSVSCTNLHGLCIMGVAKLMDKIFVLSRCPQTILEDRGSLNKIYTGGPPNTIYVFRDGDSNPLVQETEIKLSALITPWDLVSSPISNCLYVSDIDSKHIYKINNKYKLANFLSCPSGPCSISVSQEGCLILAKNGQPCNLELYTSAAVLLDCIQLPSDVASVIHAVETTSGSFVVLHASLDGSRSLFEVSRVKGIIRSFSPNRSCQQLDDPRHLALDCLDRVFVVDHGSDHLVHFDAELNVIQVHERHGMFAMKRLAYDAEKKHLMVGHSARKSTQDNFDGLLSIYRVCE